MDNFQELVLAFHHMDLEHQTLSSLGLVAASLLADAFQYPVEFVCLCLFV